MTERKACSALRGDACFNGFMVSGACHGTDGTPMCMKEEVCAHVFANLGGIPRVVYDALHGPEAVKAIDA
ncbi:hypothetical protein [Caballeronia sp. DA-9]|uniref:hypothetical protein n=1 Tax=Caballeronia sp. DA-9 TaxID=3436237 RepID=UPI003F66F0B1